jgi:hypothetical protein
MTNEEKPTTSIINSSTVGANITNESYNFIDNLWSKFTYPWTELTPWTFSNIFFNVNK